MGYSKEKLKQRSTFFECVLNHPYIALMVLCIAITPLKIASVNNFFSNNVTIIISATVFSLLVFTVLYLYVSGRINTRNIIVLMMVAGFLLRVLYILYTDLTERQHDIGNFADDDGHSTYIIYLMNNKHLPDFDVRERWQFYHPPLFHTICAAWLSLLKLFFSLNEILGCVQIITLFCSSAIMIISYKIFKELKIKETGLIVSVALVCFAPIFIYFAGTVNNDIMSVMFMLFAILWAIRWYKNSSFKNIIPLALCIGFGMMTKLSVWMVAVPVALMFLVVLIRNIKILKSYILQYVVFGVICIPLGIWWEIRNFVLYNVPLAYIPSAGGVNDSQYIGNGVHSLMQRLFDFDFSQLTSVYDHFVMFGDSYNEYNPTIGLFKTGLFGERINDTMFPNIKVSGVLLFWAAVLLTLIALVCLILFLFKGNKNSHKINNGNAIENTGVDMFIKIFLALFVFINLASYYSFCINYPLTCTQHARYCMSAIPIGAAYLGMCFGKDKSKIIKVIIVALTIIYCLSSAYIYSVIN